MKHHKTNKNKSIKSRNGRRSRKSIKSRKSRKRIPVLKDNFYYYVNNGWFSSTFISENDSDKSNFTIIQKMSRIFVIKERSIKSV